MSAADPDDGYGSDDYEAESPIQPSPTRSHHIPIPSPAVQQQQQFDTDAVAEDGSDGEVVTPLPKAKSKRSQTPREPSTVSGRDLMDNTPWTYTVSALQVRMLRIPVTESAAIRELRVFTMIDKQAAQSRGSRWKQERYSVGGESPLRSTKKRGRRSRSPRRMERYRRSGLIEEAKWVKGDGKLQWTFPMEKFRHLKAYAPRIKAFVYGIGEAGVVNHSRTQAENLARQEKEGAILSFGWFFLDLRTPDLPERWLKLQNSPFGGEILISSTFSPVEISPTQSNMKSMDRMLNTRKQSGTATVNKVPTIVSGESGEYLQIGDGNGQDIYVLSVFIQAALNLAKVVEISMGENHRGLGQTGFWLSYSLFDVVVQTDVFYNLGAAEFPPIRDSFRVKSNLKDLTLCIASLGSLTVFMCTDNQVLAGVEIPLQPLLSKGLFAGSTKNEDALRSGDMSEIKGDFSFPDFDEAVISASFAVELVEINTSKTAITQRSSQVDKVNPAIDIDELEATPEQGVQTDTSATKGEMVPAEQLLFKLDHLQLKTSALSPFIGEESISIEVTLGEQRASGGLVFCSYTKQQTFATSTALGVILDNVSSDFAIDTPIHIRCFSSISKRLIAASAEVSKVVQDDKGYLKTIVLTMLNESKQPSGKCMLTCTSGPDTHQDFRRELLSDASGDKRHYRMCLKLKSIRDIEIPGGYSLRYLNPFLSSALINSDWFTVKDTGEVETLGFYCMFDLTKDPLQLKQEMQESVNIDLISSDDERMGSAIFSLSYLYFSEERFCCSEDNCEEIFLTQAETEVHWLEVHTESTLPDTQAGPEAYSHSYRSCSISIPIVSADNSNESSRQQPRRMGSIRVSAYLEDIGLLTEDRAAAQSEVLFLPPPPLQEKESKREESSTDSQFVVTSPVREVRTRSNSTSVIRAAEETKSSTVTTRGPVPTENTQPIVEQDHNREREKEAIHFKEVLEREKSAWKQEQHLQQLQWKRRFAEMEKARMDELEEEWTRREEERSNLIKAAQEEYQRLEQTLRKSLADLETRERRLAIAEAVLLREQEAKHDENESLQRRLKSEQHHTLSMAKKQTEAYERRIALLETQLSDAEKRTKQVEADFVEYRQQQRKLPESRLREEIAALKGSVSELEKQKMTKERECEIAESNVQTMKAQLEQMASLLTQEKKKHEARVVDELEKLRVKYIAREEKYVLDGDRDELRAIKKQLDDLKGFKLKSDGGNRRSYRPRSISPQHHRNHWHTQNRQTAFVCHARSTNHQSESPGSSFHTDHASGDGRDLDAFSYVETRRPSTTPQLSPHVSRSDREFSGSQSYTINHQETPTNLNIGDDDFDATGTNSHLVPPNTEIGRLLRERQLLLASGAYDTQSYLVRELDRLISVMKANAEHHSSIA